MRVEQLVSVIIPTYKRADTLPRAIDSVLKQTYKNIEILVVDDNDPLSNYRRDTEDVMRKYQHFTNVIYLRHERNKNGSAARNTGFRHSNGEYIMFLDDDDEFLPEKVGAQVECLNRLDDSWGACYTNYVREKNGVITVYGAEKREGRLLKEELMRNLFVHAGSNLMIRKTIVDEIEGFDESFMRNQDIEFLSRILIKYKLAYVDVMGLVVHIHERISSKKNFEEITAEYLKKFAPIINNLSEDDRNSIAKMINLQIFRNRITSVGERKKAVQQVLSGDLSLGLMCRYLFYLLNRKISKKAYGFKM